MRTRISLEHGASAVEYGLLVAAIAALIMAVVFALGGVIGATFQQTGECISTVGNDPNCNPEAGG